ncbi:MAG TPA: undecaprenyl-diphosphate phosphatase [Acidimicrobiia bacterium]|nr:undecaprenyl-diphosphate phosphatase [Acidimicrobiia bacterium]
MLNMYRAIIIALFQGVTELFPVSSLGHSVLIPALVGWDDLVKAQSTESPYLAFLVALHVGTAIALLIYFRSEWVKIIGGVLGSAKERRITTPDARIGMLLIVATIPTGVIGLAFEHSLRTIFAKPEAAAIFLTINGVMLLVGEALRRRVSAGAGYGGDGFSGGRSIDSLSFGEAFFIGCTQVGSLFAGISRSGITMVGGLMRGLDHEDAARFSFLLATPIILGAGVYKIPDLFGHLGDGIRGQALVGAVVAGVAAYISTRFLVRFFETKSLTPFGIYCLVIGIFSMVRFAF